MTDRDRTTHNKDMRQDRTPEEQRPASGFDRSDDARNRAHQGAASRSGGGLGDPVGACYSKRADVEICDGLPTLRSATRLRPCGDSQTTTSFHRTITH